LSFVLNYNNNIFLSTFEYNSHAILTDSDNNYINVNARN